MFLSSLRAHSSAQGFVGNAANADHRGGPPHSGPDAYLVEDCRFLISQHDLLLKGIENGSCAKTSDHSDLTASLRQADDTIVFLLKRISAAPALSTSGVQGKHAVAVRLLSVWCEQPSPNRDVLLLSLLRDAERLCYSAVTETSVLLDEGFKEEWTTPASGEACLQLIERLEAGWLRWEQDGMDLAERNRFAHFLSNLQQQSEKAIAALAAKVAVAVSAIEVKGKVLHRLLEASDGDVHPLCVDLTRSYLKDLETLLVVNERRRDTHSSAGSLWGTISGTLRRLTVGGYHG